MVKPTFHDKVLSAFAAGSFSAETMRGMIDERAGPPMANTAACNAINA